MVYTHNYVYKSQCINITVYTHYGVYTLLCTHIMVYTNHGVYTLFSSTVDRPAYLVLNITTQIFTARSKLSLSQIKPVLAR